MESNWLSAFFVYIGSRYIPEQRLLKIEIEGTFVWLRKILIVNAIQV